MRGFRMLGCAWRDRACRLAIKSARRDKRICSCRSCIRWHSMARHNVQMAVCFSRQTHTRLVLSHPLIVSHNPFAARRRRLLPLWSAIRPGIGLDRTAFSQPASARCHPFTLRLEHSIPIQVIHATTLASFISQTIIRKAARCICASARGGMGVLLSHVYNTFSDRVHLLKILQLANDLAITLFYQRL